MLDINPIKPIITNVDRNDARKLCSLTIPNNKAGKLYLDVKMPQNGFGCNFISELRDRFNKLLGYEEFAFYQGQKDISGLFIRVNNNYQRQGYNLGEILRLSSIVEILENKIKNFNIVSKSSAVYFHSKYKFKPNVTDFYERNQLLKGIIADKSIGFEEISTKAQNLMDKINSTTEPAKQREYCQDANELLYEYIQMGLKDGGEQKHPLNWAMGMTLTDKNILENSEFFNEKFLKHGIDYEV